jgi:hypothetical protein
MIPYRTHPDLAQTYKWACESCGHRWEDTGVVKED